MGHLPARLALVLAVLGTVPTAWADEAGLAKLLARTDAVAKEVAAIRGLKLKHKIPNEVVDKDELRRRLLALASEEKTRAETAAESIALARWGFIPFGMDYEALLIDLLTEQIAGYYDPKTKTLTISKSAGDDPAWAEVVLAHEIDHALQDQAFDLDKFTESLADSEGDAQMARRALIEGDGIVLMLEVTLAREGTPAPWSQPMVTKAIEKSMSAAGAGAPPSGAPTIPVEGIDRAPLVIRESLMFPYRAGFSFVAALRRRQPWSAVDAAFRKPPTSTEQIIHPERYLANDPPVPVVIGKLTALRGYVPIVPTVWGELGFQLALRAYGIDEGAALQAAAGWGGDRAVVYVREDDKRAETAVGVVRSEWDSEADAIEAIEAMGKGLDGQIAGAVVEQTATRLRWAGLDGTVSWIERRGASLVIVRGAPAWAATALAAEVWTASRIGAAARRRAKP